MNTHMVDLETVSYGHNPLEVAFRAKHLVCITVHHFTLQGLLRPPDRYKDFGSAPAGRDAKDSHRSVSLQLTIYEQQVRFSADGNM